MNGTHIVDKITDYLNADKNNAIAIRTAAVNIVISQKNVDKFKKAGYELITKSRNPSDLGLYLQSGKKKIYYDIKSDSVRIAFGKYS